VDRRPAGAVSPVRNRELLEQRRAAQAAGWAGLFDSSLLVTSAAYRLGTAPEYTRSADATETLFDSRVERSTSTARPQRGRTSEACVCVPPESCSVFVSGAPRYIAHEVAAMFHRPLDWYELSVCRSP